MRAWIVVLLLVIPLAMAGEADPFVSSGVLVSTIVVGDDAPSTDVLLGIDVTNYLSQFADETPVGLAEIASKVDIDDGEVYILLGTPDNNLLVESFLDLGPGDQVKGPYLELDDNIMVISGSNDGDVSQAVELFRDGFRSSGSLVESNVVLPDVEDSVENEEVESTVQEIRKTPPILKELKETVEEPEEVIEECEIKLYCDGDVLRQTNEDCSDSSVEFCPNGCEDAKCKESFLAKLLDFLTFWN